MVNQLTPDQRLVHDWCLEHADRAKDWLVLVQPRVVSCNINRPIGVVFPAMDELLHQGLVTGGKDGMAGGRFYWVVQH
jgi:hypothetical protein